VVYSENVCLLTHFIGKYIESKIQLSAMSVPGQNNVNDGANLKRPAPAGTSSDTQVLDKKRLQELVKEVDPNEQLDEDVEDLLLHIADDFIEQTVTASCSLAKHRRAPAVEVKDVQFVLEKKWNMWIPAVGASTGSATVGLTGEQEALKPFKKSSTSEAHKARMALIRKTLRKY
jgi:transcription initiation factor TFIID subunit 12